MIKNITSFNNLCLRKVQSFKGADTNTDKCITEIQGSQTKAKVYTQNIDYQTYAQIKTLCSHPVFKDIPVRIMPDTHAGKHTVVGFTAPIGTSGAIIPSIISGDIGCGMLCVKIDTQSKNIDYDKLDNVIKTYVSTSRLKNPDSVKKYSKSLEAQIADLCKKKYKASGDKMISTIGTLGSGNHFIEIDSDDNGSKYLIIHTGSRLFGKEVSEYHQDIARRQNPYKIKDLSFLSGPEAKDYLEDMKLAAKYSQINRRIIADEIIKRMGWKEKSSFESIHNYVSKDGIIRKGAISAKEGERIIIPLNMRDGVILAKGKGNPDWNISAPHGAGRLYSRAKASELISLEDYKKTMEGIHSQCISQSTLSESPQAYKNSEEIIANIEDTAEIETLIKPDYNYKD